MINANTCWHMVYSLPSSTADAWHFLASIMGGPSDHMLVHILNCRNLLRALPTPPVTSIVSSMDDNPASDKPHLIPGTCVNIFQPSFGLSRPSKYSTLLESNATATMCLLSPLVPGTKGYCTEILFIILHVIICHTTRNTQIDSHKANLILVNWGEKIYNFHTWWHNNILPHYKSNYNCFSHEKI